ncbi:MAG: malate synthase G, partial [Pseudomonadales bacterium]|nr:malate synthase G [Pseudomonadales bacterium]
TRSGLQVALVLNDLLENDIAPGTGIAPAHFWAELAEIVKDFVPRNRELLAKRDALQEQLDTWYQGRAGQQIETVGYTRFLQDIGYVIEEGPDFDVVTENVDAEIALTAGPQLVVPVMNARYALNAANARWGSLYDALYGTDVIPETPGAEKGSSYNPGRGTKVIEYAANFLNETYPLDGARHQEVVCYRISDGALVCDTEAGVVTLADPSQLIGYTGSAEDPSGVLLKHNALHIEIQIDREDDVGRNEKAGVKDVLVESAVTTIQDFEDSVSAVDAEDKAIVYGNWLGLMRGDLAEEFQKGDTVVRRTLNPDRVYNGLDGVELTLHGRSLLLVRNVGHLMTNDAILLEDGSEIPEGIMDGMFTSLIAIHDLNRTGATTNSRTGSVYIVKPKMHGPEEVQFTVDLFARIESALGFS